MTYRPREDTRLVENYLEDKDLEGVKLLEIGTGSGEIAVRAAEKGAAVTATDIDPEAVERANERAEEAGLDVEILRSDLFENVEGRFELVVFNPPYLPGQRQEKDSLVGGRDGTEVIERFLEKVEGHLCKGGEALVVASDLSEMDNLERFDLDTVESEKMWFERLYLLRLQN